MSEAETEIQDEATGLTVDAETGEIIDGEALEPSEPHTEDEPAEDDEQTEGEPSEEAEAVAVRSDRDMEKLFREIERLRKDTARRVGNIFGDDAAELMECPLCAAVAPGYLWPQDVAPLAEEQIAALRMMLNMPVTTDYVQSEAFEACPKCEGLGRVRTGSKVQNHEIAECPRCFAKGYVPTAVHAPYTNGSAGEQDADFVTGPTVYGHELPAVDPSTQAIIDSLKDRGYMVVEPLAPPRPAS